MRFTFSRNLFDRFDCWWHNNVVEPIDRWCCEHKKTHYECCVCGNLLAPYFTDKPYQSVKYDYGWHKLDGCNRWICHHCADHSFATEEEKNAIPEDAWRDYTWDEWQRFVVIPNRKQVKADIKEKDIDYYYSCYFYDEENENE